MGEGGIRAYGDGYQVEWPDMGFRLEFARFDSQREGIFSLVSGMHLRGDGTATILCTPLRTNLYNPLALSKLAATLNERTGDKHDWPGMVTNAVHLVLKEYETGAPLVDLSDVEPDEQVPELIPGLLPEGEITVIAGDGGCGKSTTAMAIAIAVSEDIALCDGITPLRAVNVLYEDWETNQRAQSIRMEWLRKGMALETRPHVMYRNMTSPLVSDAVQMRKLCTDYNIGLVVIDSIAFALDGPVEESAPAIRAMNALSSLGPEVTKLVIAHVTKVSADLKGGSKPFGSVFMANAPRSVWTCRRDDEEDSDRIQLALIHTKNNVGPRHSPIGLELLYRKDPTGNTESVSIFRRHITDMPNLVEHAGLTDQLMAAMKGPNAAMTVADIASDIGRTPKAVKDAIDRLVRQAKVVRVDSGGRAHPGTYALVDSRFGDMESGE